MADLASVNELMNLLGDADVSPDLAESALEAAEDLFERLCGRSANPFKDAQTGRVEVKDGTGGRVLFLDYPIAALISLKIGPDSTAPLETLSVADKNVVRFRVGSPRLTRIDGFFGCYGDPNVIEITYNAAADLPDAARRAVLSGAALLYRRGASEGATAERLGGYSIDLSSGSATALEQDPAWQDGLRACRQAVFA